MDLSVTVNSGVAALLGAAIGGFFAIVSTLLNNRHQSNIRRLEERRQLRDRKHERVRISAASLLALAETMNEIIIEQEVGREGETVEDRDARLNELWRTNAARANVAMVELSLDIDADEIVTAYHATRSSFQKYQDGRSARKKEPGSGEWPREHDAAFQTNLSKLREVIRETLATLETPVEEDMTSMRKGEGTNT